MQRGTLPPFSAERYLYLCLILVTLSGCTILESTVHTDLPDVRIRDETLAGALDQDIAYVVNLNAKVKEGLLTEQIGNGSGRPISFGFRPLAHRPVRNKSGFTLLAQRPVRNNSRTGSTCLWRQDSESLFG